nr:Chain B, Signal recognition particle 54 kDa protein, chloroplast [Arabidopsis thaliana]
APPGTARRKRKADS